MKFVSLGQIGSLKSQHNDFKKQLDEVCLLKELKKIMSFEERKWTGLLKVHNN